MTTKQTIKAWKDAEKSANNSPVGSVEVDMAILAKVQGGANSVGNVIATGCIPTFPKWPKGDDDQCGIILNDFLF